MQKTWLIFTTVALLEATDGIPEEALGSIYTEALWFVSVIAVMGIISFIISTRNAKRYEKEMALKRIKKREAETENKKRSPLRDPQKDDRIAALSKLRDQGLLKDSELTVLKRHLLAESATTPL